MSRYQIEDGYDLSAVSGATDYTILQAWDMTHARHGGQEAPPVALQHSPLHRDPGAAARDQRFDNIVSLIIFFNIIIIIHSLHIIMKLFILKTSTLFDKRL